MNERIKMIRESRELNMRDFAKKIGITSSSVSKLESGENKPSERTIMLICDRFKINRDWLVNGIGDMSYEPTTDDQIVDEVLDGEDEFIKAVIRGIAKTPGGWEKMREVFEAIQNELQKKTPGE